MGHNPRRIQNIMRVTGLKVSLFVSALVALITVGEHSLTNAAAHASMTAHTQTVSAPAAAPNAAPFPTPSASETEPDYDSYVQVYDDVDEDPEHAQARMITSSYEINN